jgi:hypothetical protein
MPSVITAFRDLDRLRQIAVVLARHGFGEVVQRIGLDDLLIGAARRRRPALAVHRRARCASCCKTSGRPS